MTLSKISTGQNPPTDINVIIENPMGGEPVKYELDKESGVMFVDRFLHTAMYYPGNYGFIPHTLSGDGDPVDVLVISRTPVMPGAVLRSRPVGVLLMEDDKGQDEKIIAVKEAFNKAREQVAQMLQEKETEAEKIRLEIDNIFYLFPRPP